MTASSSPKLSSSPSSVSRTLLQIILSFTPVLLCSKPSSHTAYAQTNIFNQTSPAAPTPPSPTPPVSTSSSYTGCGTDPVHRGDKTTVCFTIGPDTNWAEAGVEYVRFNFQPDADEFSNYHIPNSYDQLVRRGIPQFPGNITVFTSSQASLSFLRMYYDRLNGRIFPHLTAIIDVDKGQVQGIVWDESCFFCSGDKCLENTYDFSGTNTVDLPESPDQPTRGCYFTVDECNADPSLCDLRLFVVWTGNDDSGNVMTSSNSRFSAFPPNRIEEAWQNALPDFTDIPFTRRKWKL